MITIAKEDAAALRGRMRAWRPTRALDAATPSCARRARATTSSATCRGERRRRRSSSAPTTTAGSAPPSTTPSASPRCSRSRARLARSATARATRICFTSRTAEEYGLLDCAFDWCTGAWQQVSDTHPEWGERSPFHLCLEASGHPDLRLALRRRAELARWARAPGSRREGRGLADERLARRRARHRHRAVAAAWSPASRAIARYTWEQSFARTDYHTPRDTIELLDFDHLERLTRLLRATCCSRPTRDPDGILDHAARGSEVARLAEALGERGGALAADGEAHGAARAAARSPRSARAARPRRAAARRPIRTSRRCATSRAGAARGPRLPRRPRAAAARQLARVGDNALARRLSREAFAIQRARRRPEHPRLSWAARSHLTDSPNLWDELASLRGEVGAEPPGAWIDRSLQSHIEHTSADLDRRLAAMELALRP